MKQNKYDDNIFFEKYGEMARSINGLDGAGEWEAVKALLPDFKDTRVLDMGCGFGWHCIYAIENGASSVLGIDLSEKMLQRAKEVNGAEGIEYKRMAIEDAVFAPESFDVVLSSLAIHYIKSFEDIVANVYRMLKDGGEFVFSAEHPVFTAEGKQDWIYDDNGKITCFPVDNYFYEGEREAIFLGEKTIKYHRTVTTYINALLKCGFEITGFCEPQPSDELIKTVDGMKDEMRRPMMIIISARKK